MLFTLQRYEFFSKSQRNNVPTVKPVGCCLPYKGTNFSANHNRCCCNVHVCTMLFTLQRYEFFSKSQHIILTLHSAMDVVYPTKVRIFQQITTCSAVAVTPSRCCLPYKGTNFSANHNRILLLKNHSRDVVYPTKVRIFQQITTTTKRLKSVSLMLFTLQRYEFFSKSQHH